MVPETKVESKIQVLTSLESATTNVTTTTAALTRSQTVAISSSSSQNLRATRNLHELAQISAKTAAAVVEKKETKPSIRKKSMMRCEQRVARGAVADSNAFPRILELLRFIGRNDFEVKEVEEGRIQLVGERRNSRKEALGSMIAGMDNELEKRKDDLAYCLKAAASIQSQMIECEAEEELDELQGELKRQIMIAREHKKWIKMLESGDHARTVRYGDCVEVWTLEKKEIYQNERKEKLTRAQAEHLLVSLQPPLSWDFARSSSLLLLNEIDEYHKDFSEGQQGVNTQNHISAPRPRTLTA
eukprot:CAMPEP_0184493196 /NCGR_PEP_ID=MMETSP0113_2-20130426/25379_1 /TAXON_ID=91329 /ORGANISM="Norrisiella sphaerica, Strain BC52" /LENGTH=300 /DNA_ID=CAMNT_0026878383 /DNA_START=245 /DNA_END=1143 /DNA_ORIENTATION=+